MNGYNKRRIRILYFLLIIICLGGLAYQYSSKISILSEKKKLKNSSSKKIVLGNIQGITKVQKSKRKWISYDFIYETKYHHNKIMDVFNYKCSFEYKNKPFLIVIDSLHPETNFILFHKRDYRYFGYPVPDSMNWVFECVEPSGNFLSPAPISPE
jgi:hypothetical protein